MIYRSKFRTSNSDYLRYITLKNIFMTEKTNSPQLSSERSSVNDRVDRMKFLGNSKTSVWRRKRRNRSI
jgi:hypothetical protein